MNGERVKGAQFPLQNSGEGTCATSFNNGFVTIGGRSSDKDGNRVYHGKVDRYDSEGNYLGSLPYLATPRYNHGCTTFISSDEQALIVAGGSNKRGKLSITEIFSNGRWTTGGTLPRAMYGLRAAHLNKQVVLTGGNSDEVLQYDVEAESWATIGNLEQKRSFHTITEVNLAAVDCVVDCKVSDWSLWSGCSATCGGGNKTRSKEVVQKPENGGEMCPDLEKTET